MDLRGVTREVQTSTVDLLGVQLSERAGITKQAEAVRAYTRVRCPLTSAKGGKEADPVWT